MLNHEDVTVNIEPLESEGLFDTAELSKAKSCKISNLITFSTTLSLDIFKVTCRTLSVKYKAGTVLHSNQAGIITHI